MTSKERFNACMSHKEPDRVPISFSDTMASGILECPPHHKKYSNLCDYLGLTDVEPADIGFMANFVQNVDPRIRSKFGADFIRFDPNPQPVVDIDENRKRLLGVFCGWEVGKIGIFDQVVSHPFLDIESVKGIKEYPYWPLEDDFRSLAIGKREEIEKLAEKTDKVIVVDTFLVFPFLAYSQITGFERWLIDMKINPDFYKALCEKLLTIGIGIVDSFLSEVGDYIDVICTYDDLGSQEGLFFSLEDYRKYVKPYEIEIINRIKKHTNAKIYRHSCGSVYDVIPDFIEMGIDILNPIQTTAKNMEPWRLKSEFGRDLVFWGGMDTQQILPFGNPDQVRTETEYLIQTLGKDGGYIFGPATNIEPDTPVENIVAMYDAAKNYKRLN